MSDFLPDELLLNILAMSEPFTVIRCQRVSQRFRHLIKSNPEKMPRFALDFVNIGYGDFGAPSLKLKPPQETSSRRRIFMPKKFTFKILDYDIGQHCSLSIFDPNISGLYFETSKESFWGERELVLRTTLRGDEAIRRVLHKITEFFTFTEVELRHLSFDDFAPIINGMRGIDSLILHVCLFKEESLLRTLEITKASRLKLKAVGKEVAPLSQGFFSHPIIRNLKSLVRDGGNEALFWNFDNSILQNFTQIEELVLHSVITRVTVQGIRQAVEEWREGRRPTWKTLVFELRNTAMPRRHFLSLFHNCESNCVNEDRKEWHFVTTSNGLKRLHVALNEGVRGCYTIELNLCAKNANCLRCR